MFWCSIAKSCLTLCDPMNCSTPRLPVLHHFPEFAQTHVHWVDDAFQPSHPLLLLLLLSSFPASGCFPVCPLFTSGAQSIGVSPSVLSMNIQGWFPLGFWSPCCRKDSQESSPAPQFECITSLVLSHFCCPALTSIHDYWKNHSFDCISLAQWLSRDRKSVV